MRGPRTERSLRRAMENATSYVDWKAAAESLDSHLGLDDWRSDPDSPYYRRDVIEDHIGRMRSYRLAGAVGPLVDFLPESLYQNLADLTAASLYTTAHAGTKYLAQAYFDEAITAIQYLCDVEIPGLTAEGKLKRFVGAGYNFGRTALMMSGGATLGYYHVGVARALGMKTFCHRLSAVQHGGYCGRRNLYRSDDELTEWFNEIVQKDRYSLVPLHPMKMLENRAVLDQEVVRRELELFIDDISFGEAYERTKRVLNVTVCPTRRRQSLDYSIIERPLMFF